MERYAIVVEKGSSSYGAYVPDLPGCVAAAETRGEVLKLIREAIEFHIEALQDDGLFVPRPSSSAEYVEVLNQKKGTEMSDKRIYVERREEGDYAIRRAGSDRASDVRPTQREAIERAKELEPKSTPHVERVRHTDKGGPDKWRSP